MFFANFAVNSFAFPVGIARSITAVISGALH